MKNKMNAKTNHDLDAIAVSLAGETRRAKRVRAEALRGSKDTGSPTSDTLTPMTTNVFPLKDGQVFNEEEVMGEIKPEHAEAPICWTLQGNWYRRSDGVQMTSYGGEVMTVQKFYQLRKIWWSI